MPSSNSNHEIIPIAERIWRINEFGLNSMYLIEGLNKALVIDVGTGVGDFKSVIEKLTSLPYDVVATHHHIDHIGGRGQFQSMYIHPSGMSGVREVKAEQRRMYASLLLEHALQADPPAFQLEDIEEVAVEPALLPIVEGETFDIGDRSIEVFLTPGHTNHCISLYDPKSRILFSGDAYNPVTLLMMDADTREIAARQWLDGAEKIAGMRDRFDYAYGGHGGPIPLEVLLDLMTSVQGFLDGSQPSHYKEMRFFKGPAIEHGGSVMFIEPPFR